MRGYIVVVMMLAAQGFVDDLAILPQRSRCPNE